MTLPCRLICQQPDLMDRAVRRHYGSAGSTASGNVLEGTLRSGGDCRRTAGDKRRTTRGGRHEAGDEGRAT
jgi:hypothetical protein